MALGRAVGAFLGELCCGRQEPVAGGRTRGRLQLSGAASSNSRYEPTPAGAKVSFGTESKDSRLGLRTATKTVDESDEDSGVHSARSSDVGVVAANDVADQKLADDLRELSTHMARSCKKFPRNAGTMSGMLLLNGVKQRFVAVVPRGVQEGMSASAEVQGWQDGSLAYYESRKAMEAGKSPKGMIELMQILKVRVDREESDNGVTVKYQVRGESNPGTLRLCFSSKQEAEQWSYDLWDFIVKIRKGRGVN